MMWEKGLHQNPATLFNCPKKVRILKPTKFNSNFNFTFIITAPTGPPMGFVASSRSPTEIIAQWSPPAEEHRNGQILGYVIRYMLFGYSQNKIEVN